MKRRWICQLCVLYVLLLAGAYFVEKERFFDEFQASRCEELFGENAWGYIVGKVYKKEKDYFYVEALKLLKDNQYVAAEERLPVYLAEENAGQLPGIGETVLIKGIVQTFQDAPNPGNFNQKLYYQKQNIHVRLYNASIEAADGKTDVFRETLWRMRREFSERILQNMGERYGGILCAMLLGETAYVQDDVKELYQKSGIAHLIAISGLHMSFIGMGSLKILQKAGVNKKAGILISLGWLFLYYCMIGGGVSSKRAYIMFAIHMGAQFLGREYDGFTALAIAALVTLADNPLCLFDTGFLLSYGAVAAIYAVAPFTESLVGKRFAVPVSLQIVLVPIMLYSYYEINVYSILWNLAAVPLASVVLVTGIIGVIGNVTVSFEIAKGILWFYESGSEVILRLPLARCVIGKPEIEQILWYGVFMAGMLYFGVKRKEGLRAGVCLIAGILMLSVPQQAGEELEVTMLNVGQGDCFFIRTSDGTSLLIDGGSSTISDVGRYRIEPYLKSEGVGVLDYVFVTHGDEDHISGIREMIMREQAGVSIKHLVLPPRKVWDEKIEQLAKLASQKEIRVYEMHQGQKIVRNQLEILCLWPQNDSEKEGNEASLVLSVTFGQFDQLFTGDLEMESEKDVCKYMKNLQKEGKLTTDYEVLKVGHHGSRNSTSEELLELVKTEIALVSAGEKNSYGHPHEEVLIRLANHAINLYNTKDGNTPKLCTDGEKYYILEP